MWIQIYHFGIPKGHFLVTSFKFVIGNVCWFSCRWAAAYAGLNLMQNYGINLFDAIDPRSKWNGHVLAASQAAGSLGSFCAIYTEKFATNSGLFICVLGSAIMCLFCVLMGTGNIFLAYLSYILSSGIYWCLACLVYARCGRLIADRHFILLFSLNNFAGLLLQTLLQAVLVSILSYAW